uniref:Putative secreted protein n=1 Tax=Anopheles darlingi TaxID=43151 RepID=A0A2M4D9G6_ANODA
MKVLLPFFNVIHFPTTRTGLSWIRIIAFLFSILHAIQHYACEPVYRPSEILVSVSKLVICLEAGPFNPMLLNVEACSASPLPFNTSEQLCGSYMTT